MKMTRLEWRYLQRIALDHPFFDTHELPLTEKEAKAIVEANIKMTGREFVDSIYTKLGMTRPEEKKDRFAWLRNIGELFTVPPIRKIAIAVLVVVLMTVFFTATPTGRAIAESVIHYIATLFEDGHLTIERNDQEHILDCLNDANPAFEVEQLDAEDRIVYVNTFDEFIKATGKTPVVLPLSYKELYYDYDEFIDLLTLYAMYDTPQGSITTVQNWSADEAVLSTDTGYYVFDSDSSIYYSNENEGQISISKVFDDSYIIIFANGSFTLEELITILKNN